MTPYTLYRCSWTRVRAGYHESRVLKPTRLAIKRTGRSEWWAFFDGVPVRGASTLKEAIEDLWQFLEDTQEGDHKYRIRAHNAGPIVDGDRRYDIFSRHFSRREAECNIRKGAAVDAVTLYGPFRDHITNTWVVGYHP